MNVSAAAAACALATCVSMPLAAQTLGEIAKRIEQGRKMTGAAVTLDDGDVSVARARQDFLEYRLDAARWQRFLEADRHVARAVAADPSIRQRLEGLNYTSIRSVGWFFNREPAIAAALRTSNVDAHEFAYAYLGAKLAFSDDSDARTPAVQQNLAFLKTRARDINALSFPLDAFSLHALGASAPAPAAAMALPAAAPVSSVSSDPAPLVPSADEEGPIDMSMGAQIPDFPFVDFQGRRRQLSDFRGRYVMLDFWGSWCPPCRAEVPYVKDAYARFGSRGFEVLGMDSERTATVDQVRDYLRENGVQWTFATPDSVRSLINDRFQIQAFPTVILLGPDGRVVESRTSQLRGSRLARTLDRILPR